MNAEERAYWKARIAEERAAEDRFAQACRDLDSMRERGIARREREEREREAIRERAVSTVRSLLSSEEGRRMLRKLGR